MTAECAQLAVLSRSVCPSALSQVTDSPRATAGTVPNDQLACFTFADAVSYATHAEQKYLSFFFLCAKCPKTKRIKWRNSSSYRYTILKHNLEILQEYVKLLHCKQIFCTMYFYAFKNIGLEYHKMKNGPLEENPFFMFISLLVLIDFETGPYCLSRLVLNSGLGSFCFSLL